MSTSCATVDRRRWLVSISVGKVAVWSAIVSHLRRARWGLESARGPASSIGVFPDRVEPCPIQRTRSAGLEHRLEHRALGNAGAREKAVRVRLRRNRHRRRADRSSRHPRDEGGRGDGDRAAQISRCRRRVASGDHLTGRSSLADRQGGVRRARRAGPGPAMIENGFIYIPETAAWLAEYLHEMTVFPKGKHDDQVDSTAQFLDWFGDRGFESCPLQRRVCKLSVPLQLMMGLQGSGSTLSRLEYEGVTRSMRRWSWDDVPRTRNSVAARWDIGNEYQVQDMLWAILAPIFPDVDDEEWLKSLGQHRPRTDLAIPSLELIVEGKFLRPGGKSMF